MYLVKTKETCGGWEETQKGFKVEIDCRGSESVRCGFDANYPAWRDLLCMLQYLCKASAIPLSLWLAVECPFLNTTMTRDQPTYSNVSLDVQLGQKSHCAFLEAHQAVTLEALRPSSNDVE